MAGHTYVCKTQNFGELVSRMQNLAEGTRAEFEPKDKIHKVIDKLNSPNYKRIKWFLYCDQQYGNTIRLYDSKFFKEFRDLYKEPGTYVILRGENLGGEQEQLKKDIRDSWDEIQKAPREININNPKACLDYFKERNPPNGPNNKKNDISIPDPIKKRYEKLIEKTYLEASWFFKFENLLEEHRQVILEGPPGSGKTFVAEKFAKWWTTPGSSRAAEGSEYKVIQFHESYGYEDFFQGIKPILKDGNVIYDSVPGIFYNFCTKARVHNENTRFVLIIDEINRGKASRIFGEMLYLLEYREKKIKLASGEEFDIPKNVYIIGTMNTADRSIALVDYALRRRFKFVALHPVCFENNDAPVLRGWLEGKEIHRADDIVKIFCELNKKIIQVNEHYVVGHSYFMTKKLNENLKDALSDIWEFSIMPLMAEYQSHLPTKDLEGQFGLNAISKGAGVQL